MAGVARRFQVSTSLIYKWRRASLMPRWGSRPQCSSTRPGGLVWIMLGRDGFIQAYNGQAAVDADNQIIVARRLTNNASDQDGLLPLIDAAASNTGCSPAEVSADNGFCSEANLEGRASATFVVMSPPAVPNIRPMASAVAAR